MAPRRRAPNPRLPSWARRLSANTERGDRVELAGLPDYLRIAENELEATWGYLRRVDDPPSENLLDLEANLEFLYLSVKHGGECVNQPPDSSLMTTVELVRDLIDAAKKASTVFRRLAPPAGQGQQHDGPGNRRLADDLDVLLERRDALVAKIDELRAGVSALAQAFAEAAAESSGTSHPGPSAANDNDRRFHHQRWSAAG
jgi:hypothetical protein